MIWVVLDASGHIISSWRKYKEARAQVHSNNETIQVLYSKDELEIERNWKRTAIARAVVAQKERGKAEDYIKEMLG